MKLEHYLDMQLHNRINGEELKNRIREDNTPRVVLSFYKYYHLNNPHIFRDHLYLLLEPLGVLGRIYVSYEGINAQISVPENHYSSFREVIQDITFLKEIRLNEAVQHAPESFFKLAVKVRNKIVADGLNDDTFDVTQKGKHITAEEFNKLARDPDTIIVDMRNHYESEVGHFKQAILPDVDTFRDALPLVEKMLEDKKEKNIVMYCTGGIRCEKASAYYRHKGFKNVFQLEGGIIKYANDVKRAGLENLFIGKNFVFDERLGERISDDVIATCHQCGNPCDTHTNCENVACNLLFIQCEECAKEYDGCCSSECQEIIHLPEEVQKERRKGRDTEVRIFTKGGRKSNVSIKSHC